MNYLCNFTIDDLAKELAAMGEPSFIAAQIVDWVYHKGVNSWDAMSNLSAQRRKLFSEKWIFPALQFVSSDGQKFIWKLTDKKLLEASLDRNHAIIASQAGPVKRNVEAGEIVEEVLHLIQKVPVEYFTFKGESLKNYESIVKAIQILSHPKMLNISQRRMTLQTSGNIEGIKLLSHEQVKVDLIIGLHGPNQYIRNKIMPNARKNPLEQLLTAAEEYAHAAKRSVVYEYAFTPGLNDSTDHAFELANLLKRRSCSVSIIPHEKTDKKALKDFRTVLFGSKVNNVIHSS